MAPSLVTPVSETVTDLKTKVFNKNGSTETSTTAREPLKQSGNLDQYESFDVTPVIGREFKTGNLAEWLRAPNSDELLRDLAITSTFPHDFTSNKRY